VRVLIVKLSALGDVIHALPVLDYLHQAKPGIEIDWIVEEAFSPLLAENRRIAELVVIRARSWRKRPFAAETRRELMAVVRRLRERNYDMVFDIQGNIKSGVTAWLSGCPDRLGFAREVTQESANTWFTTRQIPLRPIDRHITDQCLRVVSVSFGKDFNQMELATEIPVSDSDEKWAAGFVEALGDGFVFLFHCGTTWQTKFWHEAGWVELARRSQDAFPGCTILLTWGNESERLTAERIAAGAGSCARVVERMPLGKLVGLLKKADLVVGGDTGIVHAAAAVGTPTVSFYRASDANRSGPRGSQHKVIQTPMPCARCFRTSCDQDQPCRESIKAEDLLSAMETVLQPSHETPD
jgi:heptosyltransferase-1